MKDQKTQTAWFLLNKNDHIVFGAENILDLINKMTIEQPRYTIKQLLDAGYHIEKDTLVEV